MIAIHRSEPPPSLKKQTAIQRQEQIDIWVNSVQANPQLTEQSVALPTTAKGNFWRTFIKELHQSFHGKCVYCETQIAVSNSYLLYYRPYNPSVHAKEGVIHYFWLTWQWPNMYLACYHCYKNYPSDARYFPIAGQTAQPGTYQIDALSAIEQPMLLDLCFDNPAQHIAFSLQEGVVHLEGITERGKKTIELLKLNHTPHTNQRTKQWQTFQNVFERIVQKSNLAVDLSQESEGLLKLCAFEQPYAGMKRYFLQQWLDDYSSSTIGPAWDSLRAKLYDWRTEKSDSPLPFPPPLIHKASNGIKEPIHDDFPIVLWRVSGVKDEERNLFNVLLKKLCTLFKRIVVEKEFGAGFSGARVFLVSRLSHDDKAYYPIIVKFDAPQKLKEEVKNYAAHQIASRLEKCVKLENEGNALLEVENIPYACISYRFAGSGKFTVESLKEYWRNCSSKEQALAPLTTLFNDWSTVWKETSTESNYLLQSYDWLFPPNFEVDSANFSGGADVGAISPGNFDFFLSTSNYSDTNICISSFVITEVNGDKNEVTVDLPGNYYPLGFRIRFTNVDDVGQFSVGHVLSKPVCGKVIRDRLTYLKGAVNAAYDNFITDLNTDRVVLPGADQNISNTFDNPLNQIAQILQTDLSWAKVSTVHGDMNLENILVRSGTNGADIYVIDFGNTKKMHNVHDLLRLETSIWLYQVAWKLQPLHELDREAMGKQVNTITSLFARVHNNWEARTLSNENLATEYAILRKVRELVSHITVGSEKERWEKYYLGLALYMLGALKYKNLDEPENKAPLPKQIAFQVACLAYHYRSSGGSEIQFEPLPNVDPQQGSEHPTTTGFTKKDIIYSNKKLPKNSFHEELASVFSVDEIRIMCTELGIEFEDLAGETRSIKAIELIKHCKRRGWLEKLIVYCEVERPHINWRKLRW